MKLTSAIDLYVADMTAAGRFNSPKTDIAYRGTLNAHAEDVSNRDPRYTNRDDVKRTLGRWKHPNTQGLKRAHLVSFYDWLMEEGFRKDNPARQTRKPKRRPAKVYRMTRSETAAFLRAATTARERRAAFTGTLAGLRRQELLGLQGRHFARPGWVWVSSDIAKGKRERWVPVLPELEPIAAEVCARVELDEYVLPAQRWRDPGHNTVRGDLKRRSSSEQALWTMIGLIGRRAGISAPIGPHAMRHAFGDHICRFAGVRNAQFLLGHAGVGTTEAYLGKPTLDELAAAVRGFTFGVDSLPVSEPLFYSPTPAPVRPLEAPTRLELVWNASRTAERLAPILERLWQEPWILEAAGVSRGSS